MFGESHNNNNDDKVVKIDISYNFIVKIVAIVLGGLFLYLIRSILAILLVSIILTTAISPFVDLIHKKKKLPRWVGILIIYIGIIGIFVLVIGLLMPALIKELQNFIDKVPYLYELVNSKFSAIADSGVQDTIKNAVLNFVNNLATRVEASNTIFQSFSSIISGFAFFFMTLVVTFYMSMEEDGSARLIKALVPKQYHTFSLNLLNKIQKTVGSWLKGQLSLCLIIGTLYYISFVILGVNYTLLLAVFAGVMEIIPYIGPVLGAAPAAIIGFTQSPIKGLFVILIIILIQQLENNLIVPKVMKKSVGLNPLIVIIVIMIGVKIAGIAGALLAVPFTAIIQVIAREMFHFDQEGIFNDENKKDNNEDISNKPITQ